SRSLFSRPGRFRFGFFPSDLEKSMPKNLRPWLRFITNETASPGEGGSGGGGGEQETVPAPGEGENEQTDPEGLGEKGLKALQSEREARKQAEKRIAELESGNLPLVQLQDELKAAQ